MRRLSASPPLRLSASKKGFTLIELLIVIGIIGFLAAAVLVAVDPVKRIQDARDARRFSEANAILNAILTKQVDDRGLYSGANSAKIITSPTYGQVIVTSDAGIECDTALTENYPGCNVALDTTTAGPSKNCVANLSDITVGTGTATSAGTGVVTGSGGQLFLTQVNATDTFTSASGSTCIVRSVSTNTSLTCAARTLTGTAVSSAQTVTGTGTKFQTEVTVGDILTSASGGVCQVTVIGNDTTITCLSSPSPVFAGAVTTPSPFPPFAGTFTTTLANPLTPNYIASVPLDPRGSGQTICQTGCTTNGVGITTVGTTNSGYYVRRTPGNRVEIGACSGEQVNTISVTR